MVGDERAATHGDVSARDDRTDAALAEPAEPCVLGQIIAPAIPGHGSREEDGLTCMQ